MSEIIKDGEKTIVKPGCDIVASMVDALKEELKQVIEDSQGNMAMDLSGVGMMDSMGLGVLIATHNSLKINAGKLEIINASSDILKLLRNMRLDQHFSIVG